MEDLLTAAEMRALERAAMEAGEVTGLELMERAGQAVVEAIFAEWPELPRHGRAVVLCGPGNNGGDGFVVARLLRARGWNVQVFFYGDPDRQPADARATRRRWEGYGRIESWSFPDLGEDDARSLFAATFGPNTAHLVVDALFGTGLGRPADSLTALFDVVEHTLGNGPAVWVSVDVPSGLCADSGRLMRRPDVMTTNYPVVPTDLTVTFHAPKVGHYIADGPRFCGSLVVRDIGLGHRPDGGSEDGAPKGGDVFERPGGTALAVPSTLLLGKANRSHKYHHGHALILSGPPGKGGAARMAARGALRIGAGLVTLGCPPAALQENAAQLDAIMLRAVNGPERLAEILNDARLNAVGLGPGLGTDDRAAALIGAVLEASREGDRRVVFDADALTVLAGDAGLRDMLHERCVLTPHAGEFKRLFPDIAENLSQPAESGPAYSKVDAAREAAARAGCVLLYKGPDTVIAAPDGQAAINSAQYERSAPWLATAGTGDVLTGLVTGLLARGLAPMEAAGTAAWLQAAAALSFGPGLIAEDLPEELPKVFLNLGL